MNNQNRIFYSLTLKRWKNEKIFLYTNNFSDEKQIFYIYISNLNGKHFNIYRSFVFYLIFSPLSLAERHSHTERILEDVEMVSLQRRKMIKQEILKLFIRLHHLVQYES